MVRLCSVSVWQFISTFAFAIGDIATVNAGGFALREQSAFGQGSSYAGVAAGGSLSLMFWNPATVTQFAGTQLELPFPLILPYGAHIPAVGSTLAALGGTRDTINDVFVPSGYASWQINPQTWIGLSINAPFGLSESFPDIWAGRNYAESSNLTTYDVTPTAAFKFNDRISLGAGLQVQHASANLHTGLGDTPGLLAGLSGDGWSVGFTAGLTVMPIPSIQLGLGWRSGIDQAIQGTLALPSASVFSPPLSTPGPVHAAIHLPDLLSLGARLGLSPEWTVLGTIEWSNWSRIDTAHVLRPSGASALIATVPVSLPFQFNNSWFYSAGVEYRLDPAITLRTGIAFESSPVSDRVRVPLVPDSDRIFTSLGASARLTRDFHFDFAYSHVFMDDARINIVGTNGNPWFNPLAPVAYVGEVSSHIDLITIAISYGLNG